MNPEKIPNPGIKIETKLPLKLNSPLPTSHQIPAENAEKENDENA